MIASDFDVKLKLIILTTVALIVLIALVAGLWHKDHHFNRYLGGVTGVIIALIFIVSTLLLNRQ